MLETSKPVVALIGRPNVGKSTLFNRLAGQRTSIVSDISGTTRDRVALEITWSKRAFILVDTGGLDLFPETDLWNQIKNQINFAIEESDVIVMVVDVGVGITPADMEVSNALRRTGKPVVLAANKSDNDLRRESSVEFYELGLGDPIPISAYHNTGVDDIMAAAVSHFPEETSYQGPASDLNLAIVGRPNVGKSLLLNTLTGENRAIVSEVPGTTRDSIDTNIHYDNWSILLIDTAGIRRRGSIDQGIERYSVLRSIRAIDRSNVTVLLMDASELASNQDTHIVKYILDAHKGIILAVNKWDLASTLGITQKDAIALVKERFKFAPYAPICFVSALTGNGVGKILDLAKEVYGEWSKGVPRYDLRRRIMTAVANHPPSLSGRHSLKIYSVSQDATSPPSFTFYVNRSDLVHFSYVRYLENSIRDAYEFRGSPLRIRFKGRGER